MLEAYLAGFTPPVDEIALVDVNDWLDLTEFWPAFLFSMGTGSTAAIEAYDIDPAEVDASLDRFGGTPWPAFSWQMPDGDEVYLVFCNFEHDGGIHYLCRRPHRDSPRLIATLFHDGPAMRWPDARQLTGGDFLLQLPPLAASGPTTPKN